MKKFDLMKYRFMRYLSRRWSVALIFIVTIISFILYDLKILSLDSFKQWLMVWPLIAVYYIVVCLIFIYYGFYFFKSMKLGHVIRVKLFEQVKDEKDLRERAKIEKNLAVRKSFGFIGRKGGFIAIRFPDDLRSAELLESQLPGLADFLAKDYGFTATTWQTIIINHVEYRVMIFKF